VLDFALKVVLAWLLGSLVGSLILGRLRGGPDIRAFGSGNAGSTNAWRTRGAAFGLGVFIIDAGKGWLAVRVIAPATSGWSSLGPLFRPSAPLAPWLPVACAAAAVAGHVYPVWFGLRGGKGMATLVGTLGALAPLLLIPLAVAWLVVLGVSGFVGLASMAAIATAAAWQALTATPSPLTAFLLVATVFMVFTHRANIARMRAGTEPRRGST
jgi:acyl phosphate:glycerol-3-phosphate acyltransferase